MSLSLQATKRRIEFVNATQKITRAMKLVATAKLKVWKTKLENSSYYADNMKKLLTNVFKSIENEEELINDPSLPTLYLVITSSLGLCGGYNYNLFKRLLPEIQKNDLLLVIGSRGVSFFTNRGYQIDRTFEDAFVAFDYTVARRIGNFILSEYRLKKFSKVKIAYTKYKNSITFVSEVEEVLPLKVQKENGTSEMIFEPNPKKILDEILPLYLKSVVYGRMIESVVCEQASRRNAMDSATDNAQEIVDKLHLEYNKARQSAITQEITEVVSGANALK